MEKFFCESRVKCRSVSSSPNSGKPAISRRRSPLGTASVTLSSSGQKSALRPGEPLSKMSFVAAVRAGGSMDDGSDKRVDLLLFIHFRDADEQPVGQLGVPRFQCDSGNDPVAGTAGEKCFEVGRAQNEFIETGAGKRRR